MQQAYSKGEETMSLYDEIKSHFTLPNAYTDWEHYRNTLTDYLIAQTDQVSLPLSFYPGMKQTEILPTLAILGAGACNDLDLQRLSTHFSKITLLDYDTDSLQQALNTYHLEHTGTVECLPVSLNGITESDYRDFCEELQFFLREEKSHMTAVAFETFALSLVDACYKKSRQAAIPLAPASYDYIWCFGVHSQFQSMFSYIYHVFEVNLNNTIFKTDGVPSEAFSRRLKEENNYFIPLFHDTLLASARKAIFLGLEHNRPEKDGAIEGACQAISDIRSRSLKLTESVILWPFCPADGLSYEMLIQKITL